MAWFNIIAIILLQETIAALKIMRNRKEGKIPFQSQRMLGSNAHIWNTINKNEKE
jgi:hypothetical protein